MIGIARTSTLEQVAGLEAQVKALESYGCEKISKSKSHPLQNVNSLMQRLVLYAAVISLWSLNLIGLHGQSNT